MVRGRGRGRGGGRGRQGGRDQTSGGSGQARQGNNFSFRFMHGFMLKQVHSHWLERSFSFGLAYADACL
jgi:hypothetical protein